MLSQTFGPHSIFTVIRMGILVILRTQQISTKYECLVKLKIVLLLQTHLRYTASFYIQLFLNVSCVYAPYSSPNRVLSALAATDLKFKTNRTTKLHNNAHFWNVFIQLDFTSVEVVYMIDHDCHFQVLGNSCPSPVCNISHCTVNVILFLSGTVYKPCPLSVIPSGCAAVL